MEKITVKKSDQIVIVVELMKTFLLDNILKLEQRETNIPTIPEEEG